MSKDTDEKIDAARDKLISTSQQVVGMTNYKQIRRSYEEVMLSLINAVDAINAEEGKGDK